MPSFTEALLMSSELCKGCGGGRIEWNRGGRRRSNKKVTLYAESSKLAGAVRALSWKHTQKKWSFGAENNSDTDRTG